MIGIESEGGLPNYARLSTRKFGGGGSEALVTMAS